MRKATQKGRIRVTGVGEDVIGYIWRDIAGDVEGVYVGRVEGEALERLLWDKVAEISEAATHHCGLAAERRPGDAEARLDDAATPSAAGWNAAALAKAVA